MSPNPPQDATEILSLSRLSTAIPDIEDKALTELAWIIEVTPAEKQGLFFLCEGFTLGRMVLIEKPSLFTFRNISP